MWIFMVFQMRESAVGIKNVSSKERKSLILSDGLRLSLSDVLSQM